MRYLLLTLILVINNCKWQSTTTTAAQPKNIGSQIAGQDISDAVSKISGEKTCPEKLDVGKLSIDFIGAGVQTTKLVEDTNKVGHFVRLFFNASLCRDYLEIMRCNAAKLSEFTCRDGRPLNLIPDTDQLFQDITNPYGTTVNDAALRDCWTSIGHPSNGCVMLGGDQDSSNNYKGRIYAADHFIDVAAPGGQKFLYFARPCVHDDRVNELTGAANQNCSPRLYQSNVVNDFEAYTLDDEIFTARKEAAALAARLNYMTDEAYRITLEFSKALEQHQTDDIKRQRSKNLRQGIAMISGQLIGAAGAVYTVGVGSIGSGLDAGQALGAAFADIIASKDDYKESCTPCMKLRADLIAVVGDIDGADLSTDEFNQSQEFLDGSLQRGSGVIYQQALDKYEEALQHLNNLQKKKGDYKHGAKEIGGSRGGPP